MSELIPGLSYPDFVAEALSHATEASFRSSSFFRRHAAGLEKLLTTPRVEERPGAGPDPGAGAFRVIHWNIEKGKNLAGIAGHLVRDPYLRAAALWTLNEVDVGTARGGNVDQVRLLSDALGCHAVYLPSFIECTKGSGTDLLAEGENELGLHGLAVLSRFPVLGARTKVLPSCHDYFCFHEKRLGTRQGLYVRVGRRNGLIVATTHLEVRNTPQCRARQFAAFLAGLDEVRAAWGRELPVVLAGDWNTNTFRRGSLRRSLREFVRIVTTPSQRLDAELLRPLRFEPLFLLLRRASYGLEPFNDFRATATQGLSDVEDLGTLPPRLARAALRLFRLEARSLKMRLDWIAACGLAAAGEPRTVSGLSWEGRPVSDHDPIGVDLEG